MKILSPLFALFGALFLTVACTDQTLDQYHQDQVNQALAKMQAVAGDYKGSITNQSSGASLGNIEIYLSASTTPSASTNTISTGSTATMTGQAILVQGANTSKVDIQNIYFYSDDNSGIATVNGTISITNTDNTTSTLSINGTIQNKVYTGSIFGSAGETVGNFSATLNGAFPSSPGQASTFSGNQIANQINKYAGNIPNVPGCSQTDASGNCPVTVDITVSYIAPTQELSFLNNFEDKKTGSVTLTMVSATDSTRAIIQPITFSAAQIDSDSGSINATANTTNDGIVTAASLNCVSQPSNTNANQRLCVFHSATNGAQFTFLVTPSSAQ